MKNITLFMLLSLSVFFSCGENDSNDDQIACTLEFRIISIEVVVMTLLRILPSEKVHKTP